MATDLDRFNKFVLLLQDNYPKLLIKYKDESKLMSALSKVLFFNKEFNTIYTTTIGNTVYFPSRKFVKDDPVRSMIVLSHEIYHIKDAEHLTRPVFSAIYLAPQLLAILSIPALFIFGWWALLLCLLLTPLPSPGRMYLERRGYTMTLFALDYRLREIGVTDQDRVYLLKGRANTINKKYFKGGAYYFSWPFGLSTYFDDKIKAIDSGDILDTDEVFRTIKAALEDSKSVS